ncbi:MAG: GNAT family N-acetyltransferase [Promethearchaeota archaeon]
MSVLLTKPVPKPYFPQQRCNIQIRPANPEDIEILGDLWFYHRGHHKQWDNLYAITPSAQKEWEKQLKGYLNQSNHCVLVAEEISGKAVGYVHGSFHAWPLSPFQYYGSLNTITVAKEAQGQGIGKQLVKDLLRWFKEQQIDHISLHVDYRNRVALQLYQDVGFRPYQHRLMLDLATIT